MSAVQKLSASGSAYLAGLAILTSPRRIPFSKSIVFDAQIYVGPKGEKLYGSLRFFNSADLSIADRAELYSINATFAGRGPTTDIPLSDNLALEDYTFVGDIQSMIPLGLPGRRYLADAHSGQSEVDEEGHESTMIDPRVRPYIYVAGVATECSKTAATFELNVEQYISCVKSEPSTKKGVRLKPTTCFLCHIPDSTKFKSWSSKPTPGNKRYVLVCGFVTGAGRTGDHSEVEQILIDVENVTFCGQYVQPANSLAIASPSSPGKSPGLFSYEQLESPPQIRKGENQDGAA